MSNHSKWHEHKKAGMFSIKKISKSVEAWQDKIGLALKNK